MKKCFGSCLALFFGLTLGMRAAIPPAENLLPSDTLFLLAAPDIDQVRAASQISPGWLLWSDPAMKPFHDKVMGKWNETFIAPFEQNLGIKVSDFTELLKGQFTFAVTQNGWDGSDSTEPGILLLLDVKDKSDLLKSNLAKLQKKWIDDGKTIHTETVRGVDFTIVPLSTNDLATLLPHREPVHELGKPEKPAKPGQVVIGQYQSLLIVGNSLKAVEPVVAHLTGGSSPALRDNAVFADDQGAQFRGSPLYYGWFSAKTLFGILASLPDPEPNPEAPTMTPAISTKAMLTASGLTGVKSVSLSYRESREGSQMDVFVSAPESARQGLFKILAASPKDAAPPAFIPDSAIKFSRWRVDIQKSWAELLKTLGGISPAYLSYVNAALDTANGMAQQKTPDFDIRRDLINNLGDDVVIYEKAPSGTDLKALNDPPAIYLISSADADAAARALKNVFGLMGSSDSRDFLGHKIYSIAMPGQRTSASAPAAARPFYYSSGNGYLALSTDESMVEEFLRSSDGKAAPLRAKPGLMDAAQHVGGPGGGLFSYQDARESMRISFTALKTASAGGAAMPALVPPAFRDWFDFSLLPDFDRVSQYFYFTVFAGNTSTEGMTFKFFAPRPPQLK
jgi:hypothetical protein